MPAPSITLLPEPFVTELAPKLFGEVALEYLLSLYPIICTQSISYLLTEQSTLGIKDLVKWPSEIRGDDIPRFVRSLMRQYYTFAQEPHQSQNLEQRLTVVEWLLGDEFTPRRNCSRSPAIGE
ncbi:hypothetical protein [Agarivorans sp. 1_MG-2023]|uniref:hypothetical protein n=1 Tax=Agarivorans sp. 1_MG-2023 TaxID=3062634 RepID=UPI0026E18F59|nr:hypothetical protein [Agarivorans sp. 1_MG-2023]MDO6762046.1 hypothetical protein [Agarivorans sp. 1_MG-2023]